MRGYWMLQALPYLARNLLNTFGRELFEFEAV